MSSQERRLALAAAVQSIKRDKISYRAAAKLHGLVYETLYSYLKRTYPNIVQVRKIEFKKNSFSSAITAKRSDIAKKEYF